MGKFSVGGFVSSAVKSRLPSASSMIQSVSGLNISNPSNLINSVTGINIPDASSLIRSITDNNVSDIESLVSNITSGNFSSIKDTIDISSAKGKIQDIISNVEGSIEEKAGSLGIKNIDGVKEAISSLQSKVEGFEIDTSMIDELKNKMP